MKVNCKKCGIYKDRKEVKITHASIEICEDCWKAIEIELKSYPHIVK